MLTSWYMYAGYTTCWYSKVYVDIPLSPTGLGLYPHELYPQQLVYLAYNHGLYITTDIIVI